ncbi:MAG: NADH-quinone oxidoreductase subunit A [Deltaproteobacteria bacterium]|nr:NADH-quinone oxidoreductase subunit A [Deltaproteobacteria bacterium]
MDTYLPILIMFVIAGGFAGAFLLLSYLLGPKKPTDSKLSVYECGLNPVGSARERFSVKYYLVAILFIVFDIEVVFMYPWAVNYKNAIKDGHGAYMIAVMGVFFVMLVLGLFYEWRKGAMNWSNQA